MSEELNGMIRAEMVRRNLSMRNVAKRAGFSHATLSKLLDNPDQNPSSDTCIKLARFFGWKEDYILSLAGHRSPWDEETEPPFQPEDLPGLMAGLIGVLSRSALLRGDFRVRGYVFAPAAEVRGRELRAVRLDDALVIFDQSQAAGAADLILYVEDDEIRVGTLAETEGRAVRVLGKAQLQRVRIREQPPDSFLAGDPADGLFVVIGQHGEPPVV